MAKKAAETLAGKIDEALEGIVNEDDTLDTIKDTVRDNVDFSQIIGELFNEDEEVKEAIKQRTKILLLKKIEETEDLSDFYSDDDDMHTDIRDGLDVGEIIKELLNTDADLQGKVSDTLVKLVKEKINENLDEDDLPDWCDLRELFGIEDVIKKIVKQEDFFLFIEPKVKEVLKTYIKNNLDADDMPENISDLLGVASFIETMLRDRVFREQIDTLMKEEILSIITDMIGADDLDIKGKVLNHPETKRIADQQANDLLHDPQIINKLKDTIKTRLSENSNVVNGFVNMMFEAMAKTIAERLFLRL